MTHVVVSLYLRNAWVELQNRISNRSTQSIVLLYCSIFTKVAGVVSACCSASFQSSSFLLLIHLVP